jgi:hypothetical protein
MRVPRSVLILAAVAGLAGGGPRLLATAASGSALDVGLAFPSRVTTDVAGDIFVADTFNHVVREIDTKGNATIVAGTGTPGYSGDGGPATAAQLQFPMGLTFDLAGDLYIADEGNDRVRMVTPSGTISTVAGDGQGGAALGVASSDGDEGPATAAQINRPYSVAYANSTLYIADAQHFRIRAVTGDGIIHAFAGTGGVALPPASSGDGGAATQATFLFPTGVAADTQGNVYIAEFFLNKIRKVDPSGTITTFAGTGAPGSSGDGGPATAAKLAQPYDVAVDAQGNVLIADAGNNEVRRVSAADGTISTVAGVGMPGFSGDGGPATSAQLFGPYGVAAHGASIIIADEGNNRVRVVAGDGTLQTVAGTGAAAGAPSTLAPPENAGLPPIKHVFEIVLENEESTSIYGSAAAPYFNSLAQQAVKLDAMYGAGHASLDNYMAMFGGDAPNPNNELDCSAAAPGCAMPADPNGLPTNLGDQMDAAGLSWKIYAESMPQPCTFSPTAPTPYSAPYAERHNPGVFFQSITSDAARCAAHVVPYEDPAVGFAADLADEATTPALSLIVPNSIDDGHDGTPPASITAADTWLANNVPAILASPAYQDGGLLVITFDEGVSTQGCCGDNPGGGKIATLVLSPLAQSGVTSSVPYTHYSVLRTIEDAFGLPLLNHAGDPQVTPFGGDVWQQ